MRGGRQTLASIPDRGDGALPEGGRPRRPPPRGHAVSVPAGQALSLPRLRSGPGLGLTGTADRDASGEVGSERDSGRRIGQEPPRPPAPRRRRVRHRLHGPGAPAEDLSGVGTGGVTLPSVHSKYQSSRALCYPRSSSRASTATGRTPDRGSWRMGETTPTHRRGRFAPPAQGPIPHAPPGATQRRLTPLPGAIWPNSRARTVPSNLFYERVACDAVQQVVQTLGEIARATSGG